MHQHFDNQVRGTRACMHHHIHYQVRGTHACICHHVDYHDRVTRASVCHHVDYQVRGTHAFLRYHTHFEVRLKWLKGTSIWPQKEVIAWAITHHVRHYASREKWLSFLGSIGANKKMGTKIILESWSGKKYNLLRGGWWLLTRGVEVRIFDVINHLGRPKLSYPESFLKIQINLAVFFIFAHFWGVGVGGVQSWCLGDCHDFFAVKFNPKFWLFLWTLSWLWN